MTLRPWGLAAILLALSTSSCTQESGDDAMRLEEIGRSDEVPEPAVADDAFDQLRAYLDENFTGTAWLDHVVELRPFGGAGSTVVEVVTDFFPDADALLPAESICVAVAFFIFERRQRHRSRRRPSR